MASDETGLLTAKERAKLVTLDGVGRAEKARILDEALAAARAEGVREGQRLADDERLALVQGYLVLGAIAQDNADPREDMAEGMSAFEAAVHIAAVIERADEASGVEVTAAAKAFTGKLLASVKRATAPATSQEDAALARIGAIRLLWQVDKSRATVNAGDMADAVLAVSRDPAVIARARALAGGEG